jgi:hypothetical protein
LDSGATDHMAQSSESFSSYFPDSRQILKASNEGLFSPGTGTCSLNTDISRVELSSTLHCPDLASNLMSVSHFAHFRFKGAYVIPVRQQSLVLDKLKAQAVLTTEFQDGLYLAVYVRNLSQIHPLTNFV